MVAAAAQVTAGAIEALDTGEAGRDTNGAVGTAQGQKTDMPNTIVEADGNSLTGEWRKRKWVDQLDLDTKYTTGMGTSGTTAQVICPLFHGQFTEKYTAVKNRNYIFLCRVVRKSGGNDNTPNSMIVGTLSIDGDNIPEVFALHQNYPNPFNPVTTLRYDLPENSYVNVTIYDMLGREIRTLVNTTQDADFKSVIWNATNDYGKPVSAGVYLYQIQAGEFVQTRKMVLLK